MRFFYIILIARFLFGQDQIFEERNLSFAKALAMEKNNDIENEFKYMKRYLRMIHLTSLLIFNLKIFIIKIVIINLQ